MATKSVLIIGGSGYLGTHLALALRDQCKVFATYNTRPVRIPGVTMLHMSVENRNWVKRSVYTAKPDVVIYAAGNPSMEWAEKNARVADNAHAGGAGNVSTVSEIFQPKFIYLSSCHVFDGIRGNYHEGDSTLPNTVLGKSKVGGENTIRSHCLNYLIVRSTPVFGRGNGVSLSFLDHMRMKLDRRQRVEIDGGDYLHAPAPIHGLVEIVSKLVDSGFRNRVFHYGGLTKTSKLEFAKAFAKRFKYDSNLVAAKQRALSPNHVYQDPLDFSLNFTQAVDALKIKPLTIEEGLDLMARQLSKSSTP